MMPQPDEPSYLDSNTTGERTPSLTSEYSLDDMQNYDEWLAENIYNTQDESNMADSDVATTTKQAAPVTSKELFKVIDKLYQQELQKEFEDMTTLDGIAQRLRKVEQQTIQRWQFGQVDEVDGLL